MTDQIIQENLVVSLHYTLKDADGTMIDQSPEGEPLEYLHGHQNIVPGLEKELTGASVGSEKSVVVSPAEGYGEKEESMVLTVPRSQLPEGMEPEIGMVLGLGTDEGHTVPARVIETSPEQVILDANHELAGVTLHFDVKVASVRAATEEELTQGHV